VQTFRTNVESRDIRMTFALEWEATVEDEESFHQMGNMLRRDISSCDNLLLYESDRDSKVILRIQNFINAAKQLFPNNARIIEISSQWDLMPNLRIKSDALRTVDSLMKLTSKDLFPEWSKLFQN
jgi:hypothetical protein